MICGSKKLFFRKQIGEDFSISKLVYGDLRYACRHPNKSFALPNSAPNLVDSLLCYSAVCDIVAWYSIVCDSAAWYDAGW